MKKNQKKYFYIIIANILMIGLLVTCNTINNNPVKNRLSLQNTQADTVKPIIIKKFVDESDTIKEILFFTPQNIHLKTKDDKIIVLKCHQIKGIPAKITQKQIQKFLSKNAWIKIQKNTDHTYSLTTHLKNDGGMKKRNINSDKQNINYLTKKMGEININPIPIISIPKYDITIQ